MDNVSGIMTTILLGALAARCFVKEDVKRKMDAFMYSGIGPLFVIIAIMILTR